MKKKNLVRTILSSILIVALAVTSILTLPVSAASVDSQSSTGVSWKCATPHIDVTSVHQRGQSIGFRWNTIKGAELYRVFYKNDSGKWIKICDKAGNLFYDNNLSRTCKGACYTVRCVSSDGKKYTSGYDTYGVEMRCLYYDTPTNIEIQKVNWNKAYIYFDGDPNVENDGGYFQLYMKKGKNGSWERINSQTEKWFEVPEQHTGYDGKTYYPMCYRATITNDSVPYPGETYYYTVRCISYTNKLLDNGKTGYGQIFSSMYENSNNHYIYHAK